MGLGEEATVLELGAKGMDARLDAILGTSPLCGSPPSPNPPSPPLGPSSWGERQGLPARGGMGEGLQEVDHRPEDELDLSPLEKGPHPLPSTPSFNPVLGPGLMGLSEPVGHGRAWGRLASRPFP